MRPFLATFLASMLVASAQQPAPQQAQPLETKKTFKFEASTQLIVEDIIIKDKSGNPVTGLKAKDFVVMEDGKPQDISFCEFQTLEDTAVPAPPAEPAQKELEKRAPEPAKPAAIKAVTANQIAPEKPGD